VSPTVRRALVTLVSVAMGYASAHYLFAGSAANVVPWGVLAAAAGLWAEDAGQARAQGGLAGFAVSAAFLWFDNTDAKTPAHLAHLLPAVAVASLFGLGCGLALAWLAWTLRTRSRRVGARR